MVTLGGTGATTGAATAGAMQVHHLSSAGAWNGTVGDHIIAFDFGTYANAAAFDDLILGGGTSIGTIANATPTDGDAFLVAYSNATGGVNIAAVIIDAGDSVSTTAGAGTKVVDLVILTGVTITDLDTTDLTYRA